MWISACKALHVIGFVSWFAGLFYLVRMFVYHSEAFDMEDPKRSILIQQYNLMEWRVYKIILNPAMMITWTFGLAMIFLYGMDWFKVNYWLHLKLLLLLFLLAYHIYCKGLIKKLESGSSPLSPFQLRLFNEIPTLFLVAISFIAIYKNATNYIYLIIGLAIFSVLLVMGAKAYQKRRLKADV